MPQQITEAGTLATPQPAGNRWRSRIIEGDRWGSSGYYPAEVLERDGPTTWAEGTPIFFDHPGETERYDRPERSVRDLAGRIASTPAYETDGLYADIEFYSWAAPIVREMAGDIGLSIRASAAIEEGERDGRQGPIITQLHEGLSVDLVTRAGAGGKLVALLESARHQPHVVAVETGSDDPTHVPVIPAGRHPEIQEDPMAQIEESLRAQLDEAAGRVQALESERDAARTEAAEATRRAETAETALRTARNTEQARRIIGESDATFSSLETRGLLADLPVTEAGDLDADAFTQAVTEAATERAAQHSGVRGFGVTESARAAGEISVEDFDRIFSGKEA